MKLNILMPYICMHSVDVVMLIIVSVVTVIFSRIIVFIFVVVC